MTRIFDLNGVEQNETWLYNRYGIEIVRSTQPAHFELAELYETTGTMIHQVHVQDIKGIPLAAHGVAFHWDGGSVDLFKSECAAFKTKYENRVEVQWTNGNGDTGFELGPGGWSGGPPNGGPHADWILSDKYESDVLAQHGWLGGTNHTQMGRSTYVLVSDTTPPPDPDPNPEPTDGTLLAELKGLRADIQALKEVVKTGFRL